jgi:hypothetical protein
LFLQANWPYKIDEFYKQIDLVAVQWEHAHPDWILPHHMGSDMVETSFFLMINSKTKAALGIATLLLLDTADK